MIPALKLELNNIIQWNRNVNRVKNETIRLRRNLDDVDFNSACDAQRRRKEEMSAHFPFSIFRWDQVECWPEKEERIYRPLSISVIWPAQSPRGIFFEFDPHGGGFRIYTSVRAHLKIGSLQLLH